MLDAATLTAIGMATAFGLLIVLVIVVMAIRLVSNASFERGGAETDVPTQDEDESRDKALAAAIAVATLASRPRAVVRRENRVGD